MQLLIHLLPLLVLLALASVIDARTRKIPNWLNLVIVTGGIAQAIALGVPVTLAQSLLGILAGFGILLIPYILGAMGGGDVKMLAGIGAWLGATATLQVYLVAAVVGLVIVLVQCFLTGRLTQLLKNSTLIVANFANYAQVGRAQVVATGQSMKSVDKPLPYAVPTLISVIITVWMNLS
jgi:prepilin peptidase CpaA